ncbi:MAG: hypothetical protein ACI4T1_00765 [Christensenellales bacterium]
MFYKKSDLKVKDENFEVVITDFSKGLNLSKEENILNPNSCVRAYNFAYKKGVLTESYGFKTLTCPSYNDDLLRETYTYYFDENEDVVEFLSLWFYKIYDESNGGRVDKLMYYATNQEMYYSRIITFEPAILSSGFTLEEKPTFTYNIKYNNYDYNLIGGENMGVYYNDGEHSPKKLENCPNISSMCEDKDKLFCTVRGEKNAIYYHIGDDFINWTTTEDDNNGCIIMNDERGKINKVVSFLGYVFAIRDYGISKIFNYENFSKFDITHLSMAGNKIYENTVAICGDKMLMLTKQGIATFNGVTNENLNIDINELLKNVDNDEALAVFHSDKYYLACKANFNDDKTIGSENIEGNINNALIILDVKTLDYDIIRGVDIASMVSIKLNMMDKIAMILRNRETTKVITLTDDGKFYNEPLDKEWVSPLSDLGYSDKIKIVKDISLLSKYDAKITIFTESSSKTFKVLGRNTLSKFKVNLKGKQIGIKIESNNDKAYISNVKLNVELKDYGYSEI